MIDSTAKLAEFYSLLCPVFLAVAEIYSRMRGAPAQGLLMVPRGLGIGWLFKMGFRRVCTFSPAQ